LAGILKKWGTGDRFLALLRMTMSRQLFDRLNTRLLLELNKRLFGRFVDFGEIFP
jgi:hypothetical protein